jgi:hypothetical protein
MAFGSTITLSVNSVDKVLNRINQDNYGSEYYLRSSTDEYRCKIRHVKESPLADGRAFDRHSLEVTHTVFATSDAPEIKRIASSTFRILGNDDLTAAGYLTAAQINYVDSGTVQADLLTWQS